MSVDDLKSTSRTNWARIDALTEDEIDTSDIAPLTEDFFAKATLHRPEEQSEIVPLPIDPDVLAWFKAQGDDYERRMNVALRIYAEAHRVST